MIFVSTACVKNARIVDSVRELAAAGYKNLELTGGTERYDEYLEELAEAKRELGLTYQVHNYFPPPREHFVLNLASMDDDLRQRSIDHVREAARVALEVGNRRFGLHAGFLLDIRVDEVGRRVKSKKIHDRRLGVERFAEAFNALQEENPDVEFFIENNVFSTANRESLGGNAFLLTDYDGFEELRAACPKMNLLLDLAHLKVSCHTLGLSFEEQVDKLIPHTEYLHVSDNDGRADTNHGLTSRGGGVLRVLEGRLAGKNVTCEVYSGLGELDASVNALEALLGA